MAWASPVPSYDRSRTDGVLWLGDHRKPMIFCQVQQLLVEEATAGNQMIIKNDVLYIVSCLSASRHNVTHMHRYFGKNKMVLRQIHCPCPCVFQPSRWLLEDLLDPLEQADSFWNRSRPWILTDLTPIPTGMIGSSIDSPDKVERIQGRPLNSR
jgi:hypothetical protein